MRRGLLFPAVLVALASIAGLASGQNAPAARGGVSPAPAAGGGTSEDASAPKPGEDPSGGEDDAELPDAPTPPKPATGLGSLKIQFGEDDGTGLGTAVRIAILLTVLTIAPALIISLTSFTRIIIVLSFIRRAMALQTLPPNQVLVGLAMFLTLAIMFPVFSEIKTEAYDPFEAGEISAGEAAEKAADGLSKFLIAQTREEDVDLFLELSKAERPETPADVPFQVLVPAFILSELRTAFQMGFMIFLPFLIIDLVIAGVLLSMGMFMLPPTIISTPFKIILFVLVDGWNVVIRSLFVSFGGF